MEQVQPLGTLPTARAYHTFNTMGNKCFVVGGRTTQNTLLMRDELLCMYDVATNQWMSPGAVAGTFSARSSHRGIVIGGNQLVICGGTGQGKVRMNDTSVLKQASNGQLSWRRLSVSPFQPGVTPLADCQHEDMCFCFAACKVQCVICLLHYPQKCKYCIYQTCNECQKQ